MSALTYLIIGANRGLGLEFVKQLSAKDGVTVLATARDVKGATELAKFAERDNVQLFEVDFTDLSSLKTLASKVPPFNRLIVNGGYSRGWDSLLSGDDDEAVASGLSKELEINVVGPVKTVRTLLPQLKKYDNTPSGKKILLMGSALGSLNAVPSYGAPIAGGYSASKAAVSMLGRKMSMELASTDVSLMIMHPGWVKTDMGTDDAPVEKEDSIRGMIEVFEKAENGSFYDFEGNVVAW